MLPLVANLRVTMIYPCVVLSVIEMSGQRVCVLMEDRKYRRFVSTAACVCELIKD